jgi:hypothetical protein
MDSITFSSISAWFVGRWAYGARKGDPDALGGKSRTRDAGCSEDGSGSKLIQEMNAKPFTRQSESRQLFNSQERSVKFFDDQDALLTGLVSLASEGFPESRHESKLKKIAKG